ncbi:hypothetical protein [Parasphingorhabdus cellanae]|uniref:Uncharacterized protein n=1 Tax=Parasphingorhabdus cellanae TaxID=2806553 RepID=A0ABX7T9W2_9SPHN|nr:hypothetical protein [Parasphingorhabdus cellanae]QTD57117.1 hypothetical protein J4G78_06090 [Parasphingorhabdus cellanae]
MRQSRPKSILWFERFYFLSLAMELFNEYVTWPMLLEDVGWEASSYILVWGLIVGVSFIIWYFLAVKAKSWARWTQIILAGIGAIILLFDIGAVLVPALQDSNLTNVRWEAMAWPENMTALYVMGVFVNLFATHFLFRKDAINWFDRKHVDIDTVFD